MCKIIILGSGAAPGVPSLSCGWGSCDSQNPKNRRTRTSTYVEIDGVKILIDTSPDVRQQMIDNQITELDAVFFSHSHADHLHGIDDLREISRIRLHQSLLETPDTKDSELVYNPNYVSKICCTSVDCYASSETINAIKQRFSYLIASKRKKQNVIYVPSINCHKIKANHPFYVKKLKVTPLKLLGHNVPSIGFSFNDGEIVHISDFKTLASSVLKQIKVRPKLLIIPLTTPLGRPTHAGLSAVLDYIKQINPEKVVINHMATECDYNTINTQTPDFVFPAYDGMIINIKKDEE